MRFEAGGPCGFRVAWAYGVHCQRSQLNEGWNRVFGRVEFLGADRFPLEIDFSDGEAAVLFIIDAFAGQIVRSTPFVADRIAKVDFVVALQLALFKLLNQARTREPRCRGVGAYTLLVVLNLDLQLLAFDKGDTGGETGRDAHCELGSRVLCGFNCHVAFSAYQRIITLSLIDRGSSVDSSRGH